METSTAKQTAPEPEALYDFGAEIFEVQFIARPGKAVFHRLRRPTIQELTKRDQASTFELIEVSRREDQIVTDEDAANAALWDKIVLAVKDYKGFPDWHELSEDEKARMRPGHKSMAVRAMYASVCKIEGDENEDISIGGDVWVVKQSIGVDSENPSFIIYHHLREPAESEYRKFKQSASRTSQTRGARKAHLRVSSNLTTYIELYNALIENIVGGSVEGITYQPTNRMRFLQAIDPVWKRQVVQTLMAGLEADLSD